MIINIDKKIVQKETKRKITDYEKRKLKVDEEIRYYHKEKTEEEILKVIQGELDSWNHMILKEKEYYSTVKIDKIPDGYMLIYNDDTTQGTGKFETKEKAIAWFTNGGR